MGARAERVVFRKKKKIKKRRKRRGWKSLSGKFFPGKETPIFLNHPFPAAVALGRQSRSKLIESSVMRFRPLLSRNFNRREGQRGWERAPKSRQQRTLGMFATSYSIILRPAGGRGASQFARRAGTAGAAPASALNRSNCIGRGLQY